jgi:diguanylate cyclase
MIKTMDAKTSPSRKQTDVFEIAKEALRLIGRYGTPPTPRVFEVWYRYVEGLNEEIREQMAHAVEEAGAVDTRFLDGIYEQFCLQADQTTGDLSGRLADQVTDIATLVANQKVAGFDFERSLQSAAALLESPADQKTLQECIAKLADGSERMIDQVRRMDSKLEESKKQIDLLRKELSEAQRRSTTDPLSGLGNRRHFEAAGNRHLKGKGQDPRLTYLVLLDMDLFKTINDRHGHDAGDQVIMHISRELQSFEEAQDICRLGGDEFAMFIDVVNRGFAVDFITRLREHFHGHRLTLAKDGIKIGLLTFSAGLAQRHPGETLSQWCNRADKMMYESKHLGRDRATVER